MIPQIFVPTDGPLGLGVLEVGLAAFHRVETPQRRWEVPLPSAALRLALYLRGLASAAKTAWGMPEGPG